MSVNGINLKLFQHINTNMYNAYLRLGGSWRDIMRPFKFKTDDT